MSKIEKIDVEELGKEVVDPNKMIVGYDGYKADQEIAEKVNEIIDYLNNK